MTIKESLPAQGLFLFRYRSYFPVILFVLVIPFLYNAHIPKNQYVIIFTFLALLSSLMGFVVRAISIATTPKGTSGRNTKEQVAESLNVSGIYSIVRHPLYLGNYLIWAGIVIFSFNFSFFIIFTLLFWVYYERIMAAEEQFLENKFGSSYLAWANQTPAFIPCFKKYKKGSIRFSMKSVLRREYSGLLACAVSFAYIDVIRFYFINNSFCLQRASIYIMLGIACLTIILRTIKHHTKILNETDRS